MRKYIFFVFCSLCVGVANAARMDVSRLTVQDEFSATFGTYFKSGFNKQGNHQTNFGAGRVDVDELVLEYTPTDAATLRVSVGENDYSDVQVGVRYKLITSKPLRLDFLADYGMAWTKDANFGNRFGNNNADAGLHVHGVVFDDWQWAFSAIGQFVLADDGNFWNINLSAELMYYLNPKLALSGEFDFNFLQIKRPDTWYDKELELGLVYNVTRHVSINPFVAYHFKTANYETDFMSYYDYWKIGVDMSAQF